MDNADLARMYATSAEGAALVKMIEPLMDEGQRAEKILDRLAKVRSNVLSPGRQDDFKYYLYDLADHPRYEDLCGLLAEMASAQEALDSEIQNILEEV